MKPPVKILSKSTPVKSIIYFLKIASNETARYAFKLCLEVVLDELPLEARHYELLGIKTVDFYPFGGSK